MKTVLRSLLRIPQAGWLMAALLAAFMLHQGSYLNRLENWTTEKYMSLYKRPATGNIVYLAIDKSTLDHVGVWPWPRKTFADTIDRLIEYDVADIFLDIDFSAPSRPDQDNAFARSLERAGGGVILAAFSQMDTVNQSSSELSQNLPIEIFQDNAWLASVNVRTDTDGIVRSFPYGMAGADEVLQSVPSILSGRTDNEIGEFKINFSINEASIPTFSLLDLLNGDIPAAELAGKSIVVGAHAVELRDTFAVPVYGLMPGPKLQVLAAETLLQNVPLKTLTPLAALAAAFALLMIMLYLPMCRRLTCKLLFIAGLSVVTEALAFNFFVAYSLIIPTAAVHLLLLFAAMFLSIRELDLRSWLLTLSRAEKSNVENILGQVFSDSHDGFIITKADGTCLQANQQALTIFNVNCQDAVGGQIADFVPNELVQNCKACINRLMDEGIDQPFTDEITIAEMGQDKIIEYVITSSKLKILDRVSTAKETVQYVACITARDVTLQREQASQLNHLSRHDELTGALRRSAFLSELDEKLCPQLHKGIDNNITVFTLNLHRFKTVNATLGRNVGDRLLLAIFNKLQELNGANAPIARLAGDSFAFFRTGGNDAQGTTEFCDSIIQHLEQPFDLGDVKAQISVHMGLASFNGGKPIEASNLLDNAELALDEARRTSGTAIVNYNPISSAQQARAREIERELWKALDAGELFLVYQPQVDMRTGALIGVEALTRWQHPELGFISPGEFIEIAETNGFITELGRWALNQACCDAVQWDSDITVAVNVSPIQLAKSDIILDIKSALKNSGLPAHRLQVEITESSFVGNTEELIEKLHDIRALGVSLALDDFGTGYASFGYISRFPLNKIKVDQMFIRTLTTDETSRSIVQFVKSLADSLDMKLICEGVETEQQAKFLKLMGCNEAQGYLFGKPQSASDIAQIINRSKQTQGLLKSA